MSRAVEILFFLLLAALVGLTVQAMLGAPMPPPPGTGNDKPGYADCGVCAME